jgi:RHS repeat-associated protein
MKTPRPALQGEGPSPLLFAVVAAALALAACAGDKTMPTTSASPDEITTVQSAVNTTVLVTVRDTGGAAQAGVTVWAEKQSTGSFVQTRTTNAQGVASLSLAAAHYRFATPGHPDGYYFFSGAAGSCTTPACTSASITVTTPVVVSVVDTDGVAQIGTEVLAETTAGALDNGDDTDATGHATISLVPATYHFVVPGAGIGFSFMGPVACTVPGCTTSSVTITHPVTVTVVDAHGNPLANTEVLSQDTNGGYQNIDYTDAQGHVQLSATPGAYRFVVPSGLVVFPSGAPGSCVIPGCTTATIAIPDPVVVTVVNGSGQPIANQTVKMQLDNGDWFNAQATDAAGHVSFALPAGNWRFRATCGDEIFYSGDPGSCAVPGCTTASITMICGACAGKPNGTACNDANACTQTDTCQSGACVGSNPLTCAAQDQCHAAGACNMQTGACSNPAKADGTACDDGNACTTGDACHSGACVPGANSCASITAAETVNGFFWPTLAAALQADDLLVTPGDPIGFSAAVTNTGVSVFIDGELRADNPGPNAFLVKGFSETLEYQAAGSGEWTPFARVVYDTAGNVLPETALPQIVLSSVAPIPDDGGATFPSSPANQNFATGTSIPAGGHARWGFNMFGNLLLPPEIVGIVFDPAQSSGVRSVVRFDVPAGGPVAGAYALDTAVAGVTGDIDDVAVQLHIGLQHDPDHASPLSSSGTGPLATGGTRVFTGTVASPPMTPFPAFPGETEASYINRLFAAQQGYGPFVVVTGQAAPIAPPSVGASVHVAIELPFIGNPVKTGPASINAGLAGTYSMTLINIGNATASALAITDSVDGSAVAISDVVVSPTVGPAPATGTATFKAATPLDRPAGPMTDVAGVTWQDRNGNVYGPLTGSYTGAITPAHPEGYLSVKVDTGIPDVIGFSKPIVVTALDPHGNPAPGVAVHFAVSGVNPQSANVTTGADGKAAFSYAGTVMGEDTVVVSATITTSLITLDPIPVQWAQAVGTPCTGRTTPLDVMLVVDVSPSMVVEPPNLGVSAGKLEAARAAADRFIDDLTYPRDQVGVATFMGGIITSAQLATDATNAKTQLDSGIGGGLFCATNFCAGGSDVALALNFALDELAGPRRRPDAQKIVVYIGDGGADVDPTAAIARLRASGARTVAIALGSNFDGQIGVARQIADSPNDYFYSPSGPGVDFAFNNLDQDLCRNLAPLVSAGGNQGLYNVRIPSFLTLQGEVHDDGPFGDQRLTSEWTKISGPGVVTFADASAPITDALFSEPGMYVLQLAASDGYLTVADRATITVDPDPSIVGASLAVALSAPGPLETGQPETLTATLRDSASVPIRDYVVRVTVAGANPVTTTLVTDESGVAVFRYQGQKPGTDVLHATALGATLTLDSSFVSLQWIQPASGGAFLTQGWIAAPADHSRISQRVPITLSPDVTLASGTLKYYPAATPAEQHVLAANVSGAPGAILATFDTTLVANGSYVVELDGTDGAGNQKTSVVLVTVEGDYKPGRVVVELTDFTVPIAGLPITIGRRYDSLEKDKVGDFGHGWSLVIGHPRLEVNPSFGVSLTLPNGRRATFDLQIAQVRDDLLDAPSYFGVFAPSYQGEPGVFGALTQEGACPYVRYNPGDPANPISCFLTGVVGVNAYAPEFYTYTDPYGTAYRMAASGELKSITDRQGNTLSFEPNGIISSTGKSVSFVRDAQGRITNVDYPAYFGTADDAARYQYDAAGDLTTVDLAKVPNVFFRTMHHTYDQHRLLTSTDPNGNTVRTSTYDADGRLATDRDALGNVTSYTYDLATRTNTTTFPDTGVASQTFDARGLVLTETDQLGHPTTHQYDDNRNETKRTNALGEVTTATYDTHGNQTSLTDLKGTTHTVYGDDNLPTTFTDRLGHVTTIGYDDRHVPRRFADELGTRFTFTNSEQGVPFTVDDAEGHRAYLTYDAIGDVTSRTDWLGRTTRATFDDAGHKLTETTARGATTTFTYYLPGTLNTTTNVQGYLTQDSYDPNGNKVASLDVPSTRGHTNFTYNALNQLTQVSYVEAGATVGYTRDFRGNPLTATDENGHTTGYAYDHAGNLKKTTFADGKFTMRTYDALNRLATLADERGNTTSYEYDEGCGCSDRITRVTDPLGHATVRAYDANGRKASVTDANGHTTSYVYDVRGHVIETDYPDGTATHEGYDSRGRRVTMTDQTGVTTTYGYDDQGQLTSVTDPLSNVTTYGYDADGNLTSVTDANGHTTAYAYDLLKRKTGRTLPLGQVESFGYNLASDQTTHTDFRGKTTTMTYDSRARMLTKTPDPSLGEPAHSYVYSPTGMRTSMTDGSGTTTFSYDPRDRMLTRAAVAGTLTYTYDPTGNLATMRSSNTNGTSVDYTWDAANQLATVTDNRAGGTTTAAYTSTRRPATLAQPNGVGLTYSYDALDRVTSMLWRQGTSPAFGRWAYTHNGRGQRTTSTDITGRSAAYGYDDASRLASETISGDPRGASFNGALSYGLDGAGNRLLRVSTMAALGPQSFTYNANDEISGDTFDANGNTTASGGHTYAYDFEDRLVSKDSGAVTLQYNCDGARVAKTVGGVTTRYLVDDLNPTGYLQVLEEVVGGAVQTRYTYGDRIVSQTREVSGTPATSYYGYDAHGNVSFLSDANGAVTDSYDYDAWGIVVASTGSTPNTRLYVGEEFEPDLGLINLRARQYRPDTGRLLTLDQAMGSQRQPTTMNRYLYGAADPANLVDPTGRTAITEYLGVAWIGTAAANGVALGFIKLVEQNAKAAGQMILGNAAEIYFNRAVIAAAISQFFPVAAIYGMGGTIGCMLALSTPDAFAALVSIKGPNIPPQVLLWYCFPQPLSSG